MTRFYGGSPLHWLADVPRGIVRVMAQQLAAIEARESLRAVTVGALAMGTLKDQAAATQQINAWRQLAGDTTQRRRMVRTVETMRAAGVKVFGAN